MATLTAFKFETADGAESAMSLAQDLQKQYALDIEDGAIVTWPIGAKKPKTKQMHTLTGAGALGGSFWGLLFGLIFLVPFLGLAIGAAIGALAGHFADYGIDDAFIKQVRQKVTERTSALFLLTRQANAEKVADAFKTGLPKYELIASNLTEEQEARLREAFEG